MSNPHPIQSPAELLRSKLAERGWTHEELALITGRSRPAISEILSGRRGVTAEMAITFAAAFGNEPRDWLALEMERQLSAVELRSSDIEQRVRLFQLVPIRDMQRRGWIADTKDLEVLESELQRFFERKNLHTNELRFPIAARRTVRLPHLNKAEYAWCFKARQLARGVHVNPFRDNRIESVKKKLRKLAAYVKEVYRTPQILAEAGIRFVIVEPLPGTRIDGAAFWLNESQPVIALSARYDRIDNFWFTLFHELSHISHRDTLSIDNDIDMTVKDNSSSVKDIEQRANEDAASTLIPPHEMDSFIRRLGPMYAKPRIIQFAHRIKIHPGIIVGQLFHRGEIGPSANREMLAKVRGLVTETALTDGWGHTTPVNL